MYQHQEFINVKRLEEIGDGAQRHGIVGGSQRSVSADHDDFYVVKRFEIPEQIEPIAIRQADVFNNEIDVLLLTMRRAAFAVSGVQI